MWISVLQVGHCLGATSPYSLIHPPHTPRCPRSTEASFCRERLQWELCVWKYFTTLSCFSGVYSFKENSGVILSAILLPEMEKAITLLSLCYYKMNRAESHVWLLVSPVLLSALGEFAFCSIKSFPLLAKLTKSSNMGGKGKKSAFFKPSHLFLYLADNKYLIFLTLKWYAWIITWAR